MNSMLEEALKTHGPVESVRFSTRAAEFIWHGSEASEAFALHCEEAARGDPISLEGRTHYFHLVTKNGIIEIPSRPHEAPPAT